MHGLYRMFLGDARPNGEKDEWIFIDVDSIQQVIIPAVRTALKVHQVRPTVCVRVCMLVQCKSKYVNVKRDELLIKRWSLPLLSLQDSFTFTSGETEASDAIYDAIIDTDSNHLVTHENDRIWRDGVFLNRPSLLALRSAEKKIHCTCTLTINTLYM